MEERDREILDDKLYIKLLYKNGIYYTIYPNGNCEKVESDFEDNIKSYIREYRLNQLLNETN